MRKAITLLLVMLLGLSLVLCGCGIQKEPESLEYNTAYPLSTAEYRMAVNHRLVPVISQLQPLVRAEDLGAENVSDVLDSVSEACERLSGMNPPKDKASYHADLLANLDAVIRHLQYADGQIDEQPTIAFADAVQNLENAFQVSVN